MTPARIAIQSIRRNDHRGFGATRSWLALLVAGMTAMSLGAQAQTSSLSAAGSEVRPAVAASAPTDVQDPLRAHALLERAIAHYRRAGDKALPDFTHSAGFADGELYVFVVDTRGTLLASGGPAAALVGQNVADLKDVTGKPFMAEILDRTKSKGAGTVTYRWLNRVDNKVESKVTYFQKVGERIIAVGYHVARATPAQAEALLERASHALASDEPQAIAAFNRLRGEFAEDDLYVFVIDLADSRFVAHGIDRGLIGSDATALRDAAGQPIVQSAKDLVGRQDRAETEYLWPNPVTGQVERKHALLQKVGRLLVGVGYYQR
ncbi:MAG: cache domain-containing protein [Proteobacteria bacterium]|nr:cache domain-containing protein [Pseudomonadota bacterium]